MAEKMMSMLNKTELKIYPIRFNEDDAFGVLMDEIYEVTKYISQNSFFGIQIRHHKKGGTCYAFSDRNGLKKEEIEWLFNKEPAHGRVQTEKFCSLFDQHRKVYAVRNKDKSTAGSYVNYDSIKTITELSHMAKYEGLIVSLVFYPGEAEEGPQVLALFSIPRKISMKGLVYFGNRYPKFRLEEVKPDSRTEGVRLGIVRNEILVYLKSTAESGSEDDIPRDDAPAWDDDISDDFFGNPDENPAFPFSDNTGKAEGTSDNAGEVKDSSIDMLELSVRAYNCLWRAGIHTVRQLAGLTDHELSKVRNLGRKSMDEIKEKLASFQISLKDEETNIDYLGHLNALIGLSEVKKQVEKITALAKLKKDVQSKAEKKDIPIVLNMVFAGNPGTAKTTVARIFAGLLKEAGLLESSEIIEVGRADLVGKYVGHTADRVKNVFGSAKGKLLFIDEAYSLLDSREGNYGDEAINTMVQEMENNRDQTIVILAGYPGKMKAFLERNPGLQSRVPFQINFADYTADEMVQIAEKEASARGFRLNRGAKDKIRTISENHRNDRMCGNGRFSRNLVENAIMNYALRLYGTKEAVDEKHNDFVLIETDFEEAKAVAEEKPEAVIGFRA